MKRLLISFAVIFASLIAGATLTVPDFEDFDTFTDEYLATQKGYGMELLALSHNVELEHNLIYSKYVFEYRGYYPKALIGWHQQITYLGYFGKFHEAGKTMCAYTTAPEVWVETHQCR